MKKVFLIALLGGVCLLAFGQEPLKKRKYTATRITEAPIINGELNDEAWLAGEWDGFACRGTELDIN